MKNIKIINIIYFIISNRIRTSAQPIFRLSLSTLQKRLVSSNFFVSKKKQLRFQHNPELFGSKKQFSYFDTHTEYMHTHSSPNTHETQFSKLLSFRFQCAKRTQNLPKKKEKERNLFRNDLN